MPRASLTFRQSHSHLQDEKMDDDYGEEVMAGNGEDEGEVDESSEEEVGESGEEEVCESGEEEVDRTEDEEEDIDDEVDAESVNSRPATVRHAILRKKYLPVKKYERYGCLWQDCSMTFSLAKDRLRHMNGHFNSQWICPNPACQKKSQRKRTSYRKDALKRHLNKRTDQEQPQRMGIFSRKDALKRHLDRSTVCCGYTPRTHEGDVDWTLLENGQSALWEREENVVQIRRPSAADPLRTDLDALWAQYNVFPWRG
ncbi:hypothetical protein BKA93DRAFT_824490 [Sparassis latifolia]